MYYQCAEDCKTKTKTTQPKPKTIYFEELENLDFPIGQRLENCKFKTTNFNVSNLLFYVENN